MSGLTKGRSAWRGLARQGAKWSNASTRSFMGAEQMNLPLVSVVVPTYNRLNFLKEAIASVQEQTFQDWELIVIDDASTDSTWDWLQTLESERIRPFRQNKNSERSAARNLGLEKSQGQFVMFLDDDDCLRPNTLQILTSPLISDSTLVAAVGARWKFRKEHYALRIEHPYWKRKKMIWPEVLFGWCSVSGQNLYRTDVVQSVGGYKDDFIPSEDRQLWLKIAKKGYVSLVPDIVLDYRSHGQPRRPKNLLDIREKVFQEFVNSLSVEEQLRAKRIRESAHYSQKAEDEYRGGNYYIAVSFYFKAYQSAPKLAMSPLVGLPLARGLGKSLLKMLFQNSKSIFRQSRML